MTVNDRINAVRNLMIANDLDAYIIPSSDPHQSEYVAGYWKSREWISGFTGSAGIVVITANHAGLWTDSRYFIQAEEELSNSTFTLHKIKNQFASEYLAWIVDHLEEGSTIGIDAWMFSKDQVDVLQNKLGNCGLRLNDRFDIINKVWLDRPPLPTHEVFRHDIKYTGVSKADKIREVRDNLKQKSADFAVFTMLDEIAWVLNIRSRDVEYNPVCISYLIIDHSNVILFVDPIKINNTLKTALNNDEIVCSAYEDIIPYLSNIDKDKIGIIDPNTCNYALFQSMNCDLKFEASHIMHSKAIKNKIEIANWKNAMEKDGVAIIKLIRWLKAEIKNRKVSEAEVADSLAGFRAEQALYFGESFPAIVGYASNGAIVHYHPTHEHCAMIDEDNILLLDSGGQYYDGTTDITRVFALGTPSSVQIDNYTRVLKGHIALNTIQFPEGTYGVQLDVLARLPLWKAGLNYLHGTGHGVGFFLNVHEPPQGITSGLSSRGVTVLQEGMVTSNEPGYYEEGEYGIRIENLELIVKSDDKGFLKNQHITLFPMERELINIDMLSSEEKDWVNDYHKLVWSKLSSKLNVEEKRWLQDRCELI